MIYCAWENTRLFVRPPALDTRRQRWPKVSILIPARNEEARIRPCLEGMAGMEYPNYEVLVLDDRSGDRTANVVRSFAKNNGRIKLLKGKELPEGWIGKPWACAQLAKAAKGEWLFFTDADTWHLPETLKRTLQMAEGKGADALSLFTKQETRTWMESLVIPVMANTLLAFLPARWALDPGSPFKRFAGMSGQFIFIKKRVYEDFGGHATVKDEIVEDLNFGRRVVEAGHRLALGDGSDFSFCRMYTNPREVWEGFSKNFFPAVGFNLFFFLNAQVVLLLDGVAPFVVAAMGPGPLFYPAVALSGTLLGIRWLQAAKYRFPKGSVFLHPLGCLLFSLIGFNSVRWFWTGGGHWKGRRLRRA